MDRPVLCLRHEGDGTALVRVEYPPGDRGGPIRVNIRDLLIELSAPRQVDMGRWIRLRASRPAQKDHEWA
ncbi:MAG: hypothetical protein JRI66_12655 [Deltaproteobacteria bacterium]|nr:hypothetical protein [Deltaproteobacteria bacterium]